MTAWCLFYVSQTWLAASGRTALHRRTGWLGCGLLAAAVLTAFYTTLNIVRVRVDAGYPIEAGVDSPMKIVLFTNFSVLPVFTALFIAAVLLRKRREWHGRLMYWCFVLTMGPALGGGGTRLLEPLIVPWSRVPAVLPAMVVALVALIVHDLRSRGKLHPATFVGAAVNFVAPMPGLFFAFSPAGEAAFRSLA